MNKYLKSIILSCAMGFAFLIFCIDFSYAQDYWGEIGSGSEEYGESYSYQKECNRVVHRGSSKCNHIIAGWTSTTIGETIICTYYKTATGCYGVGVLQNPPRCTSYDPC